MAQFQYSPVQRCRILNFNTGRFRIRHLIRTTSPPVKGGGKGRRGTAGWVLRAALTGMMNNRSLYHSITYDTILINVIVIDSDL
jgi:hypothetical protein